MENRIWILKSKLASGSDTIIGQFTTFEAAELKRDILLEKPEYKGAKLVILPAPPFPHRFLDVG